MIRVSSNFSFLQPQNQQLAHLASLAEYFLYIDPNTCLFKLRQFGELLAKQVALKVGIHINNKEEQFFILKKLENSGLFQHQIKDLYEQLTLFHKIRIEGNNATHLNYDKPDYDTALTHIQYAWELGIWYYRSFYDDNFHFQKFVTPPNPTLEFEKELNELKEEAERIKKRAEADAKQKEEIGILQQKTESKYQQILQQKQDAITLLESQKKEEIERLRQEAESKYQDALQEIENLQQEINNNKLTEEEINNRIKKAIEIEGNINSFTAMLMGHFDNDNTVKGYENISHKLENITNAIDKISLLIGDYQETEMELHNGEKVKAGLGIISEAKNLQQRSKDLKHGIFNVLVLGTFSNGKSTLLNAMLGSRKLPMDNCPATAIITMLVYGEEENVKLYYSNNQQPKYISFEEFDKQYVLDLEDQETLNTTHYINRFKDIEFAEIECNYNLCKGGVRLIDSPGIGEQIARTKLTTEFLQQSHAVIFIFDATHILRQEEREFIKANFKQGNNNENIFFVVNKIDLVDDDDDDDDDYTNNQREKTRTVFANFIKDLYLDEQGKLDGDLLNNRLFLINSKSAFKGRRKYPIKQSLVEESGILAFEKELENFLTTGAKFRAGISSVVDLLILTIDKLDHKIIQQEKLLGAPLSVLEERRVVAEKKLKLLEERENRIKEIIDLYANTITDKLCFDLETYVMKMKDDWQFDYKEFTNLDKLNFISLFSATVDELTRNATTKAINEDLMKYLESKFETWANRIPIVINKDLDTLQKQLDTSIQDFAREISLIESLFTGENLIDVIENRADTVMQLIISTILGDFSTMNSSVMGDNDWSNFFWESIKQAVLVTSILLIFPAAIEWFVLIGTEIFTFVHKGGKSKNKLMIKIGKKVFEKVDEQVPQLKKVIVAKINEEFDSLKNQITSAIQQQIEEVRKEQNKIIQDKKDKEFSIEKEKIRISAIKNEVIYLFNEISKNTYDREYSLEEIKWVYQGKQLIKN
ncbi:dynamin family protein [Cyanobacterium aponinum FACHB-4101]|uniref:dynamin family protein n=1 Tax=Cyanobacterium aponinum TaxID=379064 RepID=UPI001680A63F|nr:dynamin family protein [Cyanobacterium aponinum]MBD2393201.1 dynamin family protein [Cyanobacterium aponinum FACHB-4101]